MVAPTVFAYGAPWKSHAVGVIYAVVLIALWLAWVAALLVTGRSVVRPRRPEVAQPA